MSRRRKILYLGDKRNYYGYGKGFSGDMFLELFREELARRHDVLSIGWGYLYNFTWKGYSIKNTIKKFGRPDMIITHDLGRYYNYGITEITIPRVHIVGDFYYGMNSRSQKSTVKHFKDNKYNFFLCPNLSTLNLLREYFPDRKCHFWPWSVDVNFFRNYFRDKRIDVAFMCARRKKVYGSSRQEVHKKLFELSTYMKVWCKKRYFGDYVDVLNSSKMAVHNNSKYGFVTKKALEIMACGSLLLTDRCEEYDVMGFRDGKHMVVYDGLEDLEEKIRYYLVNDSTRSQIALGGWRHATTEYSMSKGVDRMIKIVFGDN